MAVLYTYIDESGKFKDHSVVSISCVTGPQAEIERLDRLWRRQLRAARLDVLSMKHALRSHVALSERIPAQSPRERIRALEPFASCIRENAESVLSVAMDVEDVARVIKRWKGKLTAQDNPHMIAFAGAVYRLLDENGPNDKLSLVCDDEEEMALPCYDLYRRVKKYNEDARRRLACLSFADDAVFLSLQVADMVASLVRLEARRRFFGEQYEYSALYELIATDNPRLGTVWFDAEAIVKLGEGFLRRKTASAFGFPV
jgi:hypothetical protein